MKQLLSALLFLSAPLQASALGEVFKLNTSGTEYCADFVHFNFNPRNDIDLWVRVDSYTQITLSTTSDFSANNVVLDGAVMATALKRGAFYAHADFAGGFVTISGTASVDAFGNTVKMSGRFIQNNLFGNGCWSQGTAVTVSS